MNNKRFLRNYRLTLDTPTRQVIVEPPLRISFDANKSVFGGINSLNIDAYNLSPKNRDAIAKNKEDTAIFIGVNLEIGYGTGSNARLDSIFKGQVRFANNQRNDVDIVTRIECFSGWDAKEKGYINETVGSGGDAIKVMTESLKQYNVSVGKIEKQSKLIRPKVLIGNTIEQIKKYVKPDEVFFIDDNQIYILNKNDTATPVVPVVNAQTGLIRTPTIESTRVTFETLLNPAIRVGGQIQLESTIEPRLNGRYLVRTIGYEGDNFGDNWNQICVCEIPDRGFVKK